MSAQLLIDWAQARAFLRALSDDAESETFTWQTIDDDADRKRPSRLENGTLENFAGFLETKNRAGFAVFVTVNKTNGKGSKAKDIEVIRTIWCDWDHADRAPPAWPIPPHLVVSTSPGKYQLLWCCGPLSAAVFAGAMARLVNLGGDPGAKDLARVLRVPGFHHQKRCAAKGQTGEPYLVHIVERGEFARYPEAAIAAAFPALASRSKSNGKADAAVDWDAVAQALRHIPAADRATWFRIGAALHSTGAAQAREVWDGWARQDAKFDPDDQQKTWDSYTERPNGIAIATLFHIAREHGCQAADPDAEVTQDSIAVAFAQKFAGELRYCHSTNSWFLWTGVYWRRDETDLAFQFARQMGRKATAGGANKALKEVRKVAFASGVERFARGDRALAVTAEAWDADSFLVGTPAGTVELRTGALRRSDPADGITKITGVAPADTADCPLWRAFLFEATAGDAELMRWQSPRKRKPSPN